MGGNRGRRTGVWWGFCGAHGRGNQGRRRGENRRFRRARWGDSWGLQEGVGESAGGEDSDLSRGAFRAISGVFMTVRRAFENSKDFEKRCSKGVIFAHFSLECAHEIGKGIRLGIHLGILF
jgi:hypothetical protein